MKLKKTILILITIVTILLINTNLTLAAQELNKLDYIKLNISNNIEFQTVIGKSSSISKFDLNSYFFPKSYNGSQYLNNFTSSNKNYNIVSENSSIYINYDFSKSLKSYNKIKNSFILESTTNKPKITEKYFFPVLSKNLNQNDSLYLEFGDLIDLNEPIKNQATTLATGESDLFIISTKIANWITKDITYDLKTVLENPNQKSSDVYTSKQGVCKEITNLFVSMMRSIGIPTRIVTGYAYTESQELVDYVGSNWGGHVWAEVKMGDTWVPFDLTYNQYGFVDSTHIITDKSQFIRNNGVTLDALSFGIEIVPNSLKLENKFELINKHDKLFDNGFDIELSGPTELNFESLGYIKVKLTNTKDYYQNLFLKLAKPDEINVLNDNDNIIVFKPLESKEIYFKYEIPDLDSNYIYTFPFLIYNDFLSKEFSVSISRNFQKFEKLELPDLEENKHYFTNNNFQYNCNYDLNSQIKMNLNCLVQNPNNYPITNLKVCLDETCDELDLSINEIKEIKFQTLTVENTLLSTFKNKTEKIVIKNNFPKFQISHKLDYRELELNTEIINYLDNLKLSFNINGKLVFNDNINSVEKFNLELSTGTQNLELKLYHGETVFDTYTTTLEVQKKPFTVIIKDFINMLMDLI